MLLHPLPVRLKYYGGESLSSYIERLLKATP